MENNNDDEQLIFKLEKDLEINNKKPFNNNIKLINPSVKQISLIMYSRNFANKKKKKMSNKNNNILINSNYKDKQNISLNSSYFKNYNKDIPTSINKIKNSLLEYSNKKLEKKSFKPNKSAKNFNLIKQNINEKYEKFLKNKYNKYNTIDLVYKIENQYSKVQFNDEKDFIKRMDKYSYKNQLHEEKINEIVNNEKPKLPEKKLIETFNRLIKDSNRRNELKQKKSKITSDDILMNNIKDNLPKSKSTKPINNKQWNEIYEKRFKQKLDDYKNNLNKKKLENELKQKKNEENEIKEMEKYNKKTKYKSEQIKQLNFRLYYKPFSKLIINNMVNERKNKNNDIDMVNKSLKNNRSSRTCFTSKKISKSNSKKNNVNSPSFDVEKVVDNFFFENNF